MFRNLPSFGPDDLLLIQLAATMIEPASAAGGGQDGANPLDNPAISAGYTYLGQFIDHDITFDPTSKLQRDNDPNALRGFRTPRFDLDSVYGRGPDDQPYLYDPDGVHLRIGKSGNGEDDLPRTAPDEGAPRRALIGDPRNDENVIVSQIQLALLKFHNKVVDSLSGQNLSSSDLFN
jgi:Animal haem peroxidase